MATRQTTKTRSTARPQTRRQAPPFSLLAHLPKPKARNGIQAATGLTLPDYLRKPSYGCFQIHNLKSKTTALAFNHFNNDKVPCDVGIGNSTGEHPDWTFAKNAGGYKARRISVWVKTK